MKRINYGTVADVLGAYIATSEGTQEDERTPAQRVEWALVALCNAIADGELKEVKRRLWDAMDACRKTEKKEEDHATQE